MFWLCINYSTKTQIIYQRIRGTRKMPIACSLPISRSNLTNLATTLSTASISTNLDNKVVATHRCSDHMSWMLPLLMILFFLFLWFCFQICVFGWWIIAVVVLEVVVWWGYDLMVYWVSCGVGFARLLGFFFFFGRFFFPCKSGFFLENPAKERGLKL